MSDELSEEGRCWFRRTLAPGVIATLDEASAIDARSGARLSVVEGINAIDALAQSVLPGARPVRIVAFNKTESNNWTLPWHQDRVVALRERIETPGFSNWTNKAGTWHAEPPIALMQQMIFARVHLDAAGADNGCLQLALGTHQRGRIASEDAEAVAKSAPIEDCVAERGDVLFTHALILHRSSPSRLGTGRRAIRIDYCAESLPLPLAWAV